MTWVELTLVFFKVNYSFKLFEMGVSSQSTFYLLIFFGKIHVKIS